MSGPHPTMPPGDRSWRYSGLVDKLFLEWHKDDAVRALVEKCGRETVRAIVEKFLILEPTGYNPNTSRVSLDVIVMPFKEYTDAIECAYESGKRDGMYFAHPLPTWESKGTP